MLDDRLVAMERRLTDLVAALQKEMHASLKDLSEKVQAVQMTAMQVKAQVDNDSVRQEERGTRQDEMEGEKNKRSHEEMKEMKDRLHAVETWQTAFQAEKAERDKRTAANEGLLRWLGGSLLLAFIVAAAGAGFTAWQQMHVQTQLIQTLSAQVLPKGP